MSSTTTANPTISDHTYAIAERLRGIAADSLYTFQAGIRELSIDTFPEQLHAVGSFATHDWGISAQVWARDEHGVLQAAGEASAGPLEEAAPIHSRIRHFRSGPLLWTHIATPVSIAPISVYGGGQTYTAVGRHSYRLRPQPRLEAHPIWHLSTDDLEMEHPLFAGVASAVTYIADKFEHRPAGRRPRQRNHNAPAATHPWRDR